MQRTFDDLGQPLRDTTFCVIDFETTGGSPTSDTITEVGAVKLRGGECLGTYQTLVNPGCAIPPTITVLTGITQAMTFGAPRIEQVLPSLVEFIGSAVIVGHNIGFDMGFLNAALERDQRPRAANTTIDTVALARRLVGEEVPNCKLGTLARRFRLDHKPSHRALDDALATGDLLHVLIERATALGVTGIDDLASLPKMAGHPQAAKLAMTEKLPRTPGVYIFRDRRGQPLYVGKATNLRSRVRSYFSSDTRRKIGGLLREAVAVDYLSCANPLEAAVVEIRLIHEHQPRFNRQGTRVRSYRYVKLTRNERFPRLSVVRTVSDDGSTYLGPLSSASSAKRIIEAIESVVAIRRCTTRLPASGAPVRSAPCAAAQLGVSSCPCSGSVSEVEYARLVETIDRGLTREPNLLLQPLVRRMERLAGEERFEEAADVRDRAATLATALDRHRRFESLRRAGAVTITAADGSGASLLHGQFVRAWHKNRPPELFADPGPTIHDPAQPVPVHLADEFQCISAWLDKEAGKVRLEHSDGGLALPLPRLERFKPPAASDLSRSRSR